MIARRGLQSALAAAIAVLLAASGCGSDGGPGGPGPSGSDAVSPDAGDVSESDVRDAGDHDTRDREDASDPDPDVETPDAGSDTVTSDSGGRDGGTKDTGLPDLALTSIAPPRGPVGGGTQFVLDGKGFTQKTAVFFGSREAKVNLVNGKLVGQTPKGASEGTVAVKALDPQTGKDVLPNGFRYTTSLKVDSASPTRVPTDGGVEVTLKGRGFNKETRVSFGGESALRQTVVDGRTMRAVAPPHAAGKVDVRLTNKSTSAVARDAITYFAPLTIDRIRPAMGSVSGGTQVTLHGAGFTKSMVVRFGGQSATVDTVSGGGSKATVTIPAHSAGVVDVMVASSGAGSTTLEDGFVYAAPNAGLSLSGVRPARAPASGKIEVTLLGTGLDTSNLSVTVGGKSATVKSTGTGWARVEVPSHAPGTVDVTVSDGADSATLTDGFTYLTDLWIDKVTPAEGPASGGTKVVIRGKGFSNGVRRVLFGGQAATFTVTSDTKIEATTPQNGVRTVDVVVERKHLDARLKDGFTYTEKLQVFGFSPVRGSIAGNTYVTIRGRGFTGNKLEVSFGSKKAASLKKLDPRTLAVRTPQHKPTAVDVNVTRAGKSVTAPQQFTFFNPGARNGGAWGGPIQGAVNVSVFSQGGRPIPGAFVMLSTNPKTTYQGKTNRNGRVTLSGPDVYGEQTVSAVAPKYSSTTVQHVNAENITIFLKPPSSNGQPPPGPPTATFKGKITGLDKIVKNPGPNTYTIASVYTTKEDPWSRNPDPGKNNTVRTNGPYELTSRIGDLALVAVGGLLNTNTGEFDPLMMGVKRFQFAAEGKTYNRDIHLDIPLDKTMRFKLKNPPRYKDGPTVNKVTPWLDFGFEGVFGQVSIAKGTSDIVSTSDMPALAGELSDVEYLAIGGTYSKVRGSTGAPQSVAIKRSIKSTSGVIQMPKLLSIADVTSPRPGGQPKGGLVEFDVSNGAKPDFFYARVVTPMRKTIWEAFVPGTARRIRLPNFPDFSNLPKKKRPNPYPSGRYGLQIIGIHNTGTSYRNFSYSDLSIDKWKAYSVGVHRIQFR
ncbi:MAG: IPT/TIG domain-containing protein [Bradymonadaceae bacterium]